MDGRLVGDCRRGTLHRGGGRLRQRPNSGHRSHRRTRLCPAAGGLSQPSGERYFDEPMGKLPWDDVVVLLEPAEKVAPVGSEVVLRAGVGGADGYLRTNRRLEWSIAAGSVGHFVAVEQNGLVRFPVRRLHPPRKSHRHLRHRRHRAEQHPLEPRPLLARGRRPGAPRPRLDHPHFAGRGHQQRHGGRPRGLLLGHPAQVGEGPLGGRPVAVPAAGDQSGRHQPRLHHHGDAVVQPQPMRGLAGAV